MDKPSQMKRKVLGKIAVGALVMGLCGFNILFSIQSVALNPRFYVSQWTELGVPESVGMSIEDLATVAECLLGYFTGSLSSPQIDIEVDGRVTPIFKERELSHLEDVRELFRMGILAKHVSEVLIIIGIGAMISLYKKSPDQSPRKCADNHLAKSLKLSSAILCAIVLLIAVGAMSDFPKWWTTFHLTVFNNDLWLLDPQSEKLIQIFPEDFFFSAVTRVFLTSLGITALYLGLSLLVHHVSAYYSKQHL